MSIGFLKRALLFFNLLAIVVIAAAAWGFVSHRKTMQEAWEQPEYQPPVRAIKAGDVRTDAIGMPLGRFPQPKAKTGPVVTEAPKEDIQTALAKLGVITSAVVAYPPFKGTFPSIIFKFKDGRGTKTITLGEGLETRPHPVHGDIDPQPSRYKFVDCLWDEKTQSTFFVFDMKCDGKDLQKTRWTGELDRTNRIMGQGEGSKAQAMVKGPKGRFLFISADAEKNANAPAKDPDKTEVIKAPDRPVVPPSDVPPTIYEERDGTWTPTDDGRRYLKDNYEKVLKEARTETYKDASGRAAGVRIVSIRSGSVANQFGIRPDDVIVSINGKSVSKRSAAIKIVKDEVNAGRNQIRVQLLRNGRSIEKQFDARDPDVRRAARKLK